MKICHVLTAALLVVAGGNCHDSFALTKASDSAADAAYAAAAEGAWLGTNPTANENPPGNDNGGFGFGPWDFSGGYHVPAESPYGRLNHFIDGVDDFPASSFNDLGAPAFGLTNAQASFGVTANATRPFAEPMQIGDRLSFDFDSPDRLDPFTPQEFPFSIISLRDAQGAATLTIEGGSSFLSGDFNWSIKDGNHDSLDTGISPFATSDGSHMSFTLTAADQGILEFDGQMFEVALRAGIPTAVRFTLTGNTSGDGRNAPTGQREFFFNHLKIESADEAVVLAGDYNNDGVVDAADYTVWRDALGGDTLTNETVSPGIVDQADYEQWRSNFGNSGSGALTAGAGTVPEPAAMALWGLAGVLGLASRQLQRCRRLRLQPRCPLNQPGAVLHATQPPPRR